MRPMRNPQTISSTTSRSTVWSPGLRRRRAKCIYLVLSLRVLFVHGVKFMFSPPLRPLFRLGANRFP